ncbi:MAG: hypothetical protein KDD94_14040 [Calditrichaeota bacterium]|nr:hypothetical protein [Calditrichota bacterium]
MKPYLILILILLSSCKKDIDDQAVIDFLTKTVPELKGYTDSLAAYNRKSFYQLEFYPDSNPEHPAYYQIAVGESSPLKNITKYRFLVNSDLSEVLFFDFIVDTVLPAGSWKGNYE